MVGKEVMCVTWNTHHNVLMSVFDGLLKSQTLVDCTLAAEGRSIKAHKVIISACSPYLKSLLSGASETHPILILNDTKYSELVSLVEYMYKGAVELPQGKVEGFVRVAEALQISGVSGGEGDGENADETPSLPVKGPSLGGKSMRRRRGLDEEGGRIEKRARVSLEGEPSSRSPSLTPASACLVRPKMEVISEPEAQSSDGGNDWEPQPGSSRDDEDDDGDDGVEVGASRNSIESNDEDDSEGQCARTRVWRGGAKKPIENAVRKSTTNKLACKKCGKHFHTSNRLKSHYMNDHRGSKKRVEYRGKLPLKEAVLKIDPLVKCETCERLVAPGGEGKCEGCRRPKRNVTRQKKMEESVEPAEERAKIDGQSETGNRVVEVPKRKEPEAEVAKAEVDKVMRRYLCDLCGQMFFGSDVYAAHVTKVHGSGAAKAPAYAIQTGPNPVGRPPRNKPGPKPKPFPSPALVKPATPPPTHQPKEAIRQVEVPLVEARPNEIVVTDVRGSLQYKVFTAREPHTRFLKYLCHFCGLFFKGMDTYGSHLKKMHPHLKMFDLGQFAYQANIRRPDPESEVKSVMKRYEVKKEPRIQWARGSVDEAVRHLCDLCGKSFNLWVQFKVHCKKDHGTNRVQEQWGGSVERVKSEPMSPPRLVMEQAPLPAPALVRPKLEPKEASGSQGSAVVTEAVIHEWDWEPLPVPTTAEWVATGNADDSLMPEDTFTDYTFS